MSTARRYSRISLSITLNDTVGLGAAQDSAIVNDLSAAALDWAQYITGFTTLRIALNIVPGTTGAELANAGATQDIASGTTLDGRSLDDPSSLIALTTGNYVPGLGSDITVNLLAGNLGSIYVNPSPTPTPSGSVPAGEFDLVTVFRHELAHGLGFGGLTNSNGVLGSGDPVRPLHQWQRPVHQSDRDGRGAGAVRQPDRAAHDFGQRRGLCPLRQHRERSHGA
jgi:hypothetical protein